MSVYMTKALVPSTLEGLMVMWTWILIAANSSSKANAQVRILHILILQIPFPLPSSFEVRKQESNFFSLLLSSNR